MIAAAIVLGAFAVFAGVLWYAWRESSVLVAGEPPLVKAPEGPWKVRPEEPGGAPIVNESAPIARVLEGRREEAPVRLLQPEMPTPQVLERLRAEPRRPAAGEPEPAAGAPASAEGGEAGDAASHPPMVAPQASAAAEDATHGDGTAAAGEEQATLTSAPHAPAATREVERPAATVPPPGTSAASSPAPEPAGEESGRAQAPGHAAAGADVPASTGGAEPESATRKAAAEPAGEAAGQPEAGGLRIARLPEGPSGPWAEAEESGAPGMPAERTGKPQPAPAAAGSAEHAAPVRTAARTPAATPPAGPVWRVQLGAYSRERTALAAFEEARRRFADLVGDAEPVLVPVVVKGRTLHRLQFGAFASRAEAERVCAAIRARGGECFVARAGG